MTRNDTNNISSFGSVGSTVEEKNIKIDIKRQAKIDRICAFEEGYFSSNPLKKFSNFDYNAPVFSSDSFVVNY